MSQAISNAYRIQQFDLARNFVTFANPSGEYDSLLEYMRVNKLL